MKTYNVGDKAWLALCGMKKVQKTCPVCYGDKEVKLILGNGDEVTLPCSYCGISYKTPTGYFMIWEYRAEPELVTISSVTVVTGADGETVEYEAGYSSLESDLLFDTKEKAMSRCEEIAKQKNEEEESKARSIKENDQKSYAWNAGYHIHEAERMEEGIKYHQKMAVICKARAR